MTNSGTRVVRVLFVDEDRLLADAFAERIADERDVLVAPRVARTENHVTVVRRIRPDVVVTTDLDIARSVLAESPTVGVVVLAYGDDGADAVAAARLGVTAWMPGTSGVDDLVDAVRGSARAGHAYYPAEHLGLVLTELRADTEHPRAGPLDRLSSRELDVLGCFVEGRSGRETAAALGMSLHTLNTHSRNILRKLDVHSRLEAVDAARRLGVGTRALPRGPRPV